MRKLKAKIQIYKLNADATKSVADPALEWMIQIVWRIIILPFVWTQWIQIITYGCFSFFIFLFDFLPSVQCNDIIISSSIVSTVRALFAYFVCFIYDFLFFFLLFSLSFNYRGVCTVDAHAHNRANVCKVCENFQIGFLCSNSSSL